MWLGPRWRSLQAWAAAGALWASACQFPNYSLGNDPVPGGSGATPAAGAGSGGVAQPVGGVGAAGSGAGGGFSNGGVGGSGLAGSMSGTGTAAGAGGAQASGGSEPLAGAGEAGFAGASGDLKLLLADDFETGKTDQWFEVAGSTWALVPDTERGSNAYQLSPVFADFYASAAKDGPWTDQIIEADVKVLQFGGTGTGDVASLFGRFGNIDNYYAAVLRPDGRAAIRVSVNGAPTASIKTSAVLGITAGVWYRLRFELVGSALSLSVDGKLAIQVDDGSLTRGTIALGGDNTAAMFDNVRVTQP